MGNGTIRVFNAETGALAYTLNEGIVEALPITSIRFRPVNDKSKTKNVLLAVSADGDVQHWHVTSGRLLHSHREENNQLFCADFKSNAEQFAAAGKDHVIRIYDEATKTLIQEMDGGLVSYIYIYISYNCLIYIIYNLLTCITCDLLSYLR
jgi:COMPASS component SWD3